MMRARAQNEGIALLLAVAALMLMAMLCTGLLFIGSRERRLARARASAVRARLAAEAGARAALAGWRTDELRDLALGELRPLPAAAGQLPGGAVHRAVVQRLGGPLFLVRARGAVAGPDGVLAEARAGLLVRTLDLHTLWRAFPAALALGGAVRIGGDAQVDGSRPMRPPPPWSAADCPSAAIAPFDTVFRARPRPAILAPDAAQVEVAGGALVEGRPRIAVEPALAAADAFDHLGALEWEALERLADRIETGAVRLGARTERGRCDREARGNWGDPDRPAGPCGGYFPFILAPSGLEVTGGAGQGILIVDGDLVLRRDVRFYGVIFVRGRLLARAGARLFGAARVRSRRAPSVWGGGLAAYSACTIGRVLAATPALGGAFRPAGRWWIPLF